MPEESNRFPSGTGDPIYVLGMEPGFLTANQSLQSVTYSIKHGDDDDAASGTYVCMCTYGYVCGA